MKKLSKKDTILLGVLVVVVIITLIVLIKPKRQEETSTTPLNKIFTTPESELPAEERVQLPPFDVFENGLENDQRFRTLREYKIKIDENIKVGKDNPFEPFNY